MNQKIPIPQQLPIVTSQRCNCTKEELVSGGQTVRDFCEGCQDFGFDCRVSNHKSFPSSKLIIFKSYLFSFNFL